MSTSLSLIKADDSTPPPTTRSRSLDPHITRVVIFQQVEDPRLYLQVSTVSSSSSVPTTIGQATEGGARGQEGHWHLPGSRLLELGAEQNSEKIGLADSPVVSWATFTVQRKNKSQFMERWSYAQGFLEDWARPYVVRTGWVEAPTTSSGQDDKVGEETSSTATGEEEQEFMIFCGFPNIERHMAFRETDGFSQAWPGLFEFGRIRSGGHWQRIKSAERDVNESS
ncbi:hypothetical protein BJ166DRAFT_585292 [Pestalotiopsis sp. NC0098]|nr:hypothetical protein BJ166DRAFT_585292 [Pestalotiopsis sp. NC0098]